MNRRCLIESLVAGRWSPLVGRSEQSRAGRVRFGGVPGPDRALCLARSDRDRPLLQPVLLDGGPAEGGGGGGRG